MTKRQRIDAVIAGKRTDRPPVLGGWIANPQLLVEVLGTTVEEYNKDPEKVAIQAYQKLKMDGVIDVFITENADVYRCVDNHSYAKADKGLSYDEVEAEVEALPSPEEYERNFDFDKEYALYKNNILEMQKKCGDMVFMPANWSAGAKASWYFDYGYENFFLLIGLRPDLGAKLFQIGGANGRCQSRMIAKAAQEGLIPKAVLLGEDICTQRGPMISVDFLEEFYSPALAYGLEPLLEGGIRPVWHSDGDVRLLLPLLLESGVEGFQGFQPECGMRIEDMVKLRTKKGEKLLILGPFAVTTELPVFTPQEIRSRVRYVAGLCKDEADLIYFTSNTINPDVPLDNLLALYDEVIKMRGE